MTKHQHAFDKAIALQPEQNYFVAHTTDDYQNMVGPFGGITAALVVNTVMVHPECIGPPISLTLNYCSAIEEGAIEIHPVILKTNRSNQHWCIEFIQNGQVRCSAILICAPRRETMAKQEITAPSVPSFDAVTPVSFDFLPVWTRQYDIRIISGSPFPGIPDNDKKPTETLQWMCDKPARALDFPALTALCDAFFPRLFVLQKQMSPAGTVSLTIHFHVSEQDLQALKSPRVLGCARASAFNGGHADQTVEVFSEDGLILATSSQMVYFKG